MSIPNYEEHQSSRFTSIKFSDPTLSPVERILLSSSGTLQRTLSAFYNASIDLILVQNELEYNALENKWTILREIHLSCMDNILCVAKSTMVITKEDYFDMLVTQGIGLGQFFKLIHVSPSFRLLSYHKSNESLFRNYELSCPGVTSNIHESYPPWIGSLDAPKKLWMEFIEKKEQK